MIEDIPIFSVNVKIWKFCSFILSNNWRRYVFVIPVSIMNVLQFIYVFKEWGNLDVFILHTFYTVAVFNSLLRTLLVIKKKTQFEKFIFELEELYNEVQMGNDYVTGLLKEATDRARKISIFNLTASGLDITCALIYPLFSSDKLHPFGLAFPGVDMTAFPIFEIIYALELPMPLLLTLMYMPFVSLFASFAMFGGVLLKGLQHRLTHIYNPSKTDDEIYEEIVSCIKFHGRIIRYVRELNSLVTYMCFVEFVLFGTILCALLVCLNIVRSVAENIKTKRIFIAIQTWVHFVNIIMYIITMLYVLFTYYWQANELLDESLSVAEAAYNAEWYNCSIRVRKALLLIIIRSQSPLQVMVGNIYPMTLQTFQTILNASYSYFTIIRGIYN